MPRVFNPNAVENSLPGIVKQQKITIADLAGAAMQTFFSFVVGAGGMIVNGATQLVGGVTGGLNVTGGITATTTIAASGQVSGSSFYTAGTAQADTGISSIGVYSNLLTTSYRAVWLTSTGGTGTFGYVPSSRRFKQDIADASLPNIREVMANLRLVTFRYIAAVEELADAADTEWGVIAEEIHDLGLTWLVDYDGDGLPFGVKHERFAFLLILDAQDKQAQIDAITSRLDAAGL